MDEKQPLKYSEDYYIKKLLTRVKIEEIMTKSVICLNQDDKFSLVEEKFRENNIRHLPVVDHQLKLVGIVTQRDLYKTLPPRRLEDGSLHYDKDELDRFILKHVMTKDPMTLRPEDSVGHAVLVMAEYKYGCLPVVDKNKILCGIITQIDILKLAARILKEGESD